MRCTRQTRCDRRFICTLAALGCVGGLGCASTQPIAEEGPMFEESLGKGVVLGAAAWAPIEDPASQLGLEKAALTYEAVGSDAVFEATLSREDDVWRLDFGTGIVLHLDEDEEGDVWIVASEDHNHGVLSRYDPPEPLLIAGMKEGETLERTIGVEVFGLSSPDVRRHTGELALEYEVIGRRRIKTPAGTFDATVLSWAYDGHVGPARVRQQSYWFVADGLGPVAIVKRERISALLIINRNEDSARLLRSRTTEAE